MLVISGILYFAFVVILERVRDKLLRKAEKTEHKIPSNIDESKIEPWKKSSAVNICTKDLMKVYDKKIEAVKGVDLKLH
jgi:hypothetical protein